MKELTLKEVVMHILTELGYGDEENGADVGYMSALYDVAEKVKALPTVTPQPKIEWIPVSERLPKANEYVGNVEKHYLVQNEYGDMLVARYTHSGYWEQIYQMKPIVDEIVAWQELPEPYRAEKMTKEEAKEGVKMTITKEEAIKTLEKSMKCHDRKVCGITEDCEECPLYADKDAEYEAHKVLLECLKESDELLDKIRSEILAYNRRIGYNEHVRWCLSIIDKYREEQNYDKRRNS